MSRDTGDPKRRFPLTLETVTGQKKPPGSIARAGSLSSPQTASRNAARAATVPPPAALTTSGRPLPLATDRSSDSPLVSEAVRKAMVQRIAQQGVKDPVVLAAMEAIPRHWFVEPGLASQAYIDASLPIGYHQTISQPYIVARMIEVLREGGDRGLGKVLEIGTGCGYQAAVLAKVAGEVYSIERLRPLHELARANLRRLRIANLRLHYGDGMLGLPQAGPFDGIILAAAGLEIPQALLDQMAIGGLLVAPVGQKNQVLQRVRRTGRNAWRAEPLEPCHFVPLRPGTLG